MLESQLYTCKGREFDRTHSCHPVTNSMWIRIFRLELGERMCISTIMCYSCVYLCIWAIITNAMWHRPCLSWFKNDLFLMFVHKQSTRGIRTLYFKSLVHVYSSNILTSSNYLIAWNSQSLLVAHVLMSSSHYERLKKTCMCDLLFYKKPGYKTVLHI